MLHFRLAWTQFKKSYSLKILKIPNMRKILLLYLFLFLIQGCNSKLTIVTRSFQHQPKLRYLTAPTFIGEVRFIMIYNDPINAYHQCMLIQVSSLKECYQKCSKFEISKGFSMITASNTCHCHDISQGLVPDGSSSTKSYIEISNIKILVID